MSSSLTATIFQKGKTAVITGASSGIGRASAIECAKRGMNVFLADIDQTEVVEAAKLAKAASTCPESSIVESVVTDVSDLASVEKLRDFVLEKSGGKCHFLMNNAGVGLGGGASTSMDTVHKVMGVNTYGPMHGCLAFLPKMKEGGEFGLIVNTGSKQGITMPPGNLSYNVSKAALKVYTEGLEHELSQERLESGGKLHAALLIPGWVNTSIMLKSKRTKAQEEGKDFSVDDVFFHEDKPASGAWMPSQVFDFMLEELDKGRFYIVCPDNDVDRETDNLRMTWTMQDITEDRPPLSRWHKDYKDKFAEFLAQNKK